jgi:signal transduction histidine kinase
LLAGVRRASHLTAQLLALARLAPEAAQAPAEPLDLAALAADVLEELRPIATDRGIALEADLPPAAPYVGRGEALRLALTNALDNALRYTPCGGRVRLHLVPVDGGWCLEVGDNGPGLAAAERERAFERFYRSPQASATGSGLGLAIVREVAQLHGGSASLHDGLEGRGLALRWLLRS